MIVEIGYVVAGILIIMIPGFLFSVALFPEKMDFWKRTGSSLGLGVMLLIYEAVVLAKLKSLTFGPFIVSVVVLTGGLGVAVYLRKGTQTVRAYGSKILSLPKMIPGFRLPIRIPKPKIEEKPKVRPVGEVKPEKKCPFCGASNPPDVIFCIECGKKFETAEAPGEKPPEEKEEKLDVQVQTSDRGEG